MKRTTPVSDEDLMERLSGGQLSCAAQLFDRYQVPLYNFFLRLTHNRPLSEDLVQSVFERLIRYRSSYQPGLMFRSWIYQIARNVRTDQVGRQNRMRVDEFVKPEELGLAEVPFLKRLEQREEASRLHRAMRFLTDEQRELLILTRFQEMKYAEVADLMGTTEGAVKVRVHRAIKDLRDHYLKLEKL